MYTRFMRHTDETVIGEKNKGLLKLGDTLTWKARHLGIEQTLTAEITDMDPYRFFADVQLKGPFKQFTHQHIFTREKEGTLMKDIFHYRMPRGILGLLADALFLKRYLTRLLENRNLQIKRMAETGEWKAILGEE
jgi:ligand-binding SRPBCC domain-containing protein